MAKKFNSGSGALVCNACGKMFCEGERLDGTWRTAHRLPGVVVGEMHFCDAVCAQSYLDAEEPRGVEAAQLRHVLLGIKAGLVDGELARYRALRWACHVDGHGISTEHNSAVIAGSRCPRCGTARSVSAPVILPPLPAGSLSPA